MANDRQTLANYEAILWLWDASDEQRVTFLAKLSPDQRSQFCDVLRDVLNNPWEGRSALKLTKLNKLLGQNVDLIKKQVQFSGDRTPELDEAQLFRLLHDYLVLNHDGTQRLTELGVQNLKKLLEAVDAEFETYYGRDQSHPALMWNGFQNDTRFPGGGVAKTQVEPTDYGELNAKITNYYYPAGGGNPPPTDDNGEQDGRDDRNDYEYREGHSGGGALPLKLMHLLYFPFLLGYTSIALFSSFSMNNGLVQLILYLGTAFAAVKWYNMAKFAMRGWAAILQGAWIVYLLLAASVASVMPLAIANLVWPVIAFWLLTRLLHGATSEQRKFSAVWTSILAAICAVSIVGNVINQSGNQHIPNSGGADFPIEALGGIPDEPLPEPPVQPQTSVKPQKPPTVKSLLKSAKIAKQNSDWQGVVDAADKILAMEPYNEKALAFKQDAELRIAKEKIEKLLASARTAINNSDWQSVICAADKILAIEPDNDMAADFKRNAEWNIKKDAMEKFLKTAKTLKANSDWQGVIDAADKILAMDFSNSEAQALKREAEWNIELERHLDAACAAKSHSNWQRVIEEVNKVLEMNPYHGEAAMLKQEAQREIAVAKAREEENAKARDTIARLKEASKSESAKCWKYRKYRDVEITRQFDTLDRQMDTLEGLCDAKDLQNATNTAKNIFDAVRGILAEGERLEEKERKAEAEKARLKREWPTAKYGYLNEISRMKATKKEKTVTPYSYNYEYVAKLDSALQEFETAVGNDDYTVVSEKAANARGAFSRFESSCYWRAGISRGDGYRSSNMPGRWELEPGYEIVNGRPMKISKCWKCNGIGSASKSERCANCNGSGQVSNPAAQAAAIGGLFGVKMPVNVPKYIKCSTCNGRGSITRTFRCDACNGSGKQYRQ